MTLWERLSGNKNGRDKLDTFPELEVPTVPGHRTAGELYDKDLHELVGTLLRVTSQLYNQFRDYRREQRRRARNNLLTVGGTVSIIEIIIEIVKKVAHIQ